MKRILLLENKYKKKYRNLALMKYSTYWKQQGYEVDFFSGIDTKNTLSKEYEEIYYSTIFTFYFQEDVKTINYYVKKYPNAKFNVGGISATLMSEEFEKSTLIKPHYGLDDRVDSLRPDYDLFPNHPMFNTSEVFTSRGCGNKCKFCAVRKLEPVYTINENWRNSIDLTKSRVMLYDNNMTTGDMSHFKTVTEFLVANKLLTEFDNGFDCRFFNEEHLQAIKNIKFDRGGLRFAFDNMSQDKYIQKAISMCLDAGIGKSKILAYVLFNFNDTFEEAMYRATELRRLGVRPYPQQYRPLDDMVLHSSHISNKWNKKLVRDFRFYWMMPGIYGKMTWEDYIDRGGVASYSPKEKLVVDSVD
jgi:hypothetical protein